MKRISLLIMLLAGFFVFAPTGARAKAKVVNVEGISFNVDAPIRDNLVALRDKQVVLNLESGASVSGTIRKVGDHLVHVDKLERRDFFDALVRIDRISSIEARFREFKR